MSPSDAYDWPDQASVRNIMQGFTYKEREHIDSYLRSGWRDVISSEGNVNGSKFTWYQSRIERRQRIGRRIDLCLWKGVHSITGITRQDITAQTMFLFY